MAVQTDTNENHSVEVVYIKKPVEAVPVTTVRQPVEAACKSVRPAGEIPLSCREVSPATVVSPVYHPVGQVQETEPVPQQPAGLPGAKEVSVRRADLVYSDELVYGNIKSKKVNNNLTLRELFSEQEGY